jgi:hypothetical protein
MPVSLTQISSMLGCDLCRVRPIGLLRLGLTAGAHIPEHGHDEESDTNQEDGADCGNGVQPTREGFASGGEQRRSELVG